MTFLIMSTATDFSDCFFLRTPKGGVQSMKFGAQSAMGCILAF